MARYKLIGGRHYEAKPNRDINARHDPNSHTQYERGDVIESDRDLERLYLGKFEKIVEAAAPVITEERRQAVEAMIQSGQWSEDDRDFLLSLQNSDFARVTRAVPKSEGPVASEQKRSSSILGEDITDQFGRAYDEGLRVFRNQAGKCQVTRSNNTKKPLNKEPLEEAQVSAFVEDFLKGA